MNAKAYRYFDLIMVSFVVVLIVSNILSSAKIIDWGLSLFGMPLAFDAGTLLFPVSYVFGDILTEVYGYRRSRRVIWAGFVCLALTSLVFYIVQVLPGDATWEKTAGQGAYHAMFQGMTSGGIVAASLMGYWLGEFSNSFVLARMKILTAGKWLWTRTVGSTLVGEGVDTVVFVLTATFLGVFPASLAASLIAANYIFKVGIEVLMTPVTYWVVSTLKRQEQEDYFDTHTRFSIFDWNG
jgi:uncharacterized integral membrane protein (TIGR00697 family)